MGICDSTSNSHKSTNYQQGQGQGQKSTYVQQGQGQNMQNAQNMHNLNLQQNVSMGGSVYPKGSAILLRKIQGVKVSNDTLKKRVELYINLLKTPSQGNYAVDLSVIEKGNKRKIASLAPQSPDNNGQVRYSNYVEMDYFFEKDQSLEAMVYINNSPISICEKIGRLAANLKNSHIVKHQSGLEIEFKLIPIKSESKLYNFKVEILDSNKAIATSSSLFGNKEVFFVMKNFNDGQTWRGVYKSEEQRTCVFNNINIHEDDLFLGDDTKEFKVELFQSGNGVPLSSSTFSVSSLHKHEGFIPLASYGESYFLRVTVSVVEQLNFTQLLQKGLQISLMVGVDFTGSNGHPNDVQSLHYIRGNKPNQYESVMRSCGSILEYYDSDHSYPLFGFGGVPKVTHTIDHCFPLNFSSDPCVNSIDQMIEVYKKALYEADLSGPTYFAPLINNVAEFAEKAPYGVYFVLMILTDGEICDFEETANAIVRCSALPVSLIIIGVGDSEFDAMNQLDGDDMPLRNSQGKSVERDIVQFVPFKKYMNNQTQLSEEVLRELPEQIELYYRNNQFKKN